MILSQKNIEEIAVAVIKDFQKSFCINRYESSICTEF